MIRRWRLLTVVLGLTLLLMAQTEARPVAHARTPVDQAIWARYTRHKSEEDEPVSTQLDVSLAPL